jgi:hypothetical protein
VLVQVISVSETAQTRRFGYKYIFAKMFDTPIFLYYIKNRTNKKVKK